MTGRELGWQPEENQMTDDREAVLTLCMAHEGITDVDAAGMPPVKRVRITAQALPQEGA